MFKITEITTLGQMETCHKLACAIWREYYPPVIGWAQVEYMLAQFQSVEAIRFYQKNGFKNIGPMVQDIGGGFVMDDYKLVLEI